MDFGDIFGDFFGDIFGGGRRGAANNGPQKGANLRAQVRIKFEEAAFGCEKELEIVLKDECQTCHGTGAKQGTSKTTCTRCNGQGRIITTQQSLFGTVQNVTTCPECNGSGQIIKEKCVDCHGTGYVAKKKRISVSIPAGIDNGQSVRNREKGEPGLNGGPRGDLLVEVIVAGSDKFQRSGYDVYSETEISFAQAALGGEAVIDTLDGKVVYEVKAGTQPNTRIRLKGKGIPSLRSSSIRGDQYVTLKVVVPKSMNSEAKEALRAFDAACGQTLSKDGGKGSKRRGPFHRS
jgi:molecular chaperone DnaJ